MREGTVSSQELVALTGLTYRQLDYWVSTGYLTPVGDSNPGTGRSRRFNLEEVDTARMMVRLLGAGLSPSKAAEAAPELINNGVAHLGDFDITLGARIGNGSVHPAGHHAELQPA